MQRQKGANDEPPSDDIGWKFGTQVEGTRHHIICKFCGHHIKGGITCFKQHLAHQTGQVHSCPNVSRDVMQEMMKHLQNKKMNKTDKQKRKAKLETHIRGDDLYDENEGGDFVYFRDDDSDKDEGNGCRTPKEQEYKVAKNLYNEFTEVKRDIGTGNVQIYTL
ncbi:hypothetical protein ACSBR1_002273 [Camellia fascicularis]